VKQVGDEIAPAPDNSPAAINPVVAGLRSRCPGCGQGALYDGFLKVRDVCGVCGLDLTRLNTGDGPAVFIMQIAGFLVVFTALFVEVAYSPPMWLHLIIWPPLVGAVALALMRPMKGLMIGIQVRDRSNELGHDAR
jgi:uncharacterized protein (DUF983 family)